jgi:hypothetical protein
VSVVMQSHNHEAYVEEVIAASAIEDQLDGQQGQPGEIAAKALVVPIPRPVSARVVISGDSDKRHQ